MSRGKGTVSDTTRMLIMCHEMKWDYFTYSKQPEWFIVGLQTKITVDAEYQNKEIEKANRKIR